MPTTCFVPNCNTGYRTCREKRHLFSPPRDEETLKKWEEAISREDRSLSSKSKVCELHFEQDDILTEEVIRVNDDIVRLPRKNWALRKGAVPSIFPDNPSFVPKKCQKVTKPVLREPNRPTFESSEPEERASSNERLNLELRQDTNKVPKVLHVSLFPTEPAARESSSSSAGKDFRNGESFLRELNQLSRPSNSWNWHRDKSDNGKFMCVEVSLVEGIPSLSKSLVVDLHGNIHYFAFGRQYLGSLLPTSYSLVRDIAAALELLERANLCPGIVDPKLCKNVKYMETGELAGHCWRSNNCALFLKASNADKNCSPCKQLNKLLCREYERLQSEPRIKRPRLGQVKRDSRLGS